VKSSNKLDACLTLSRRQATIVDHWDDGGRWLL